MALRALLYFLGLGDNPINIEKRDDMKSISKDWENVGNDLRNAMNKYAAE